MRNKQKSVLGFLWLLLIGVGVAAVQPSGAAKHYKILVVMSYEKDFGWDKEMAEGIELVMADSCEIKYFYMETKKNLEGGPQKAKEAYALYEEYRPDGIIASDDAAQYMFVVPYLKDKVKTPVMFCGVNEELEKYGYPALNVSGISERLHMKETIALAQKLDSSLVTIAYMLRKGPTADLLFRQFAKEEKKYTARLAGYFAPATIKEAKEMAKDLKGKTDILFVTTMEGIPDENGKCLTDTEAISEVIEIFGGVTVTDNFYNVETGVLCGVAKTGQEQGSTAAKMLLQAMRGKPVSKIPVTVNQFGRKVINVNTMEALKIKLDPQVLRNVELISKKTIK